MDMSSHLDLQQASDAVLGNAQLIMARKLGGVLVLCVPSLGGRLLLLLSVATVLLLAQGKLFGRGSETKSETRHAPFAEGVARSVCLTMLAGVCTDILMQGGAGDTPVVLTHLCVVLVMMDAMLYHAERYTHGAMQRTMRNAMTYTFGMTVSGYVREETSVGVTCIVGVVMVVISGSNASVVQMAGRAEALLLQGMGAAGTDMLRAVVMGALPPSLQLVTLFALLCFISPIQRATGGRFEFFAFVLYTCAGAAGDALAAVVPLYHATAIAIGLSMWAPSATMRTVSTMMAMNIGSDLFTWAMQDVLRDDAFASLTSVVVLALAMAQAVVRA